MWKYYESFPKVIGKTQVYKGLQKIIEILFLIRTFPDTFFGLFCIKIKVEEISDF